MTALDQARQYLTNLPQSPADGHEAIALLSGVIAELDDQPDDIVTIASGKGAAPGFDRGYVNDLSRAPTTITVTKEGA